MVIQEIDSNRARVHSDAPSAQALDTSIERLQEYFRRIQDTDGYWWGELESNNTMEAEYVMLSRFLGHHNPERERHIVNYLLSKQLDDGSWAIYYDAPGDLSTTVECYFALKLSGEDPESDHMGRARQFVLQRGGVPRTRMFTRIWLALFGQWEWDGTPRLPIEMILLPDWAPLSIYRFASWARGCIVPLSIVLSRRPVRPIAPEHAIDELFPDGRSGTDYSVPPPPGFNLPRLVHMAEQALGKIYGRISFNPLSKMAERKAVRWILDHQEDDGSWGGIQPPWVYSLIALSVCGFDNDHPIMSRGFAGLDGFSIQKGDRWTIQGCISPVWDTCLVVQGLAESGLSPTDPMLESATRWLVDKQILVGGDWQVQAPQLQPGGWAFEFHNNYYPDIDDTAEVVLALRLGKLPGDEDRLRHDAISRALDWVHGMQNKDGGWASFDKDNNHGYVTALTFSDFGEVLDPSSADVTAHVLEMYGKLGYRTDQGFLQQAYRYLRQEQENDGSWFGRWGVNYVYGLGAVLPALEAAGEDMRHPYVRRAVQWLLDHQNADGGWGESCASYIDSTQRGVGPSTASQTGWGIIALVAAGYGDDRATHRGVSYLLETQRAEGNWDEPYFTGTGFPGYLKGERVDRIPQPGERGFQGAELSAGFMINYHLYRNTWPLIALARYRTCQTRRTLFAKPQGNGPASRAGGSQPKPPSISVPFITLPYRVQLMKTEHYSLKVDTTGAPEFMDITDWVRGCVGRSCVNNGFVVVYSRHTTAAVIINENEPLLIEDMTRFLEKMCPRFGEYRHNDFSIRTVNMTEEESPNGHAHLQHLMLGSSETIPLIDGKMPFGQWQSIFFIELDHPRPREVMVQIVGE